MSITHVIQARITKTQEDNHACHCGKKAQFLYVCYEVYTEEHMNKIEFDARFIGKEWADKYSPAHDVIYELTLREQQQQLPREHSRDYDCFGCLSSLISQGMNIEYCGEIALIELKTGSLWIFRDVKTPDRWSLIHTPHQDVAQLREDLRDPRTIHLRKT
jgi:hypothetical protein